MPKTEIVKIGSEEVEAVRDESGNGWVVVKKLCEVLGVDHSGQVKRLKDLPWPVMEMISMTAADGKIYKQLCISTESAPQWLATINPSKVAPKVKPKLIQFQKLAAKALADWFFGRNQGSSFKGDAIAETLAGLTKVIVELNRNVLTLKSSISTTESSKRIELEEDEGDITRLTPKKIRSLLGKIVSRSTDRGHGYEYRSGWDKLYRLYGRETGIDLYQTAVAMSQTQRKEVKPLDLAEKWGHLIPLYKFAMANMRPGSPRELLDHPAPTSPTKDEGTNFVSEEDLAKIGDFDSFYH